MRVACDEFFRVDEIDVVRNLARFERDCPLVRLACSGKSALLFQEVADIVVGVGEAGLSAIARRKWTSASLKFCCS